MWLSGNFNDYEDRMPVNSIIMWGGSIESIPKKWHICDGTNGTPNLIDKFIRASNSNGVTGGNDSITLTLSNLPQHSHTFTGSSHTHTIEEISITGTLSGTTVSISTSGNTHSHTFYGGSHSHTLGGTTVSVSTSGNTHSHAFYGTKSLSTSSEGSHNHQPATTNRYFWTDGTSTKWDFSTAQGGTVNARYYNQRTNVTSSAGGHTHTINGTIGGTTGGNTHSHGVNVGSHSHTVNGSSPGGTLSGNTHSHGMNVASHSHNLNIVAHSHIAQESTPNGTIGNIGSNIAFDNRPSFYSLIYIMKIEK